MAKKTIKDPNAPKRNMSAFVHYQNAMREQIKAQNPGISIGQIAKCTSQMYAGLNQGEKEAWTACAEADKQRYQHELANYVPPPGYDAKGHAILPPDVLLNKRGSAAMMAGAKGKREKDANAPKRNISAYLLYQNAMRDRFKQENPGMTFGQLAKYTSYMYKNLGPEERVHWDQRAKEDKQRYEEEKAGYVPPPNYDTNGNLILNPYAGSTKRQRKAPKDPAAPKRARTSFVLFTFDMRPQIMQEFPGIKFVDMGNILGERWRGLTPEQKKHYEDLAAQDKVRFQREMQNYAATPAHQVSVAPAPPGVVAQSAAGPQVLSGQHSAATTADVPQSHAMPQISNPVQLLVGVNPSVPHGVQEGMTQDFQQNILQQDLSQVGSSGVNQAIPQDLPPGMQQGLSDGLPQDLQQGMLQDFPQGMPRDIPQGMPQDLTPQGVPNEIPQVTSQGPAAVVPTSVGSAESVQTHPPPSSSTHEQEQQHQVQPAPKQEDLIPDPQPQSYDAQAFQHFTQPHDHLGSLGTPIYS